MAEVSLQHLTKIFAGPSGEIRAVDDVCLEVEERELLVLLGPSGCGKTTTLRLIAGLEEATAGEITIGGRSVRLLPPDERDVAMVFQGGALYPHMTVHENLAFGLKLRGKPASEILARVARAARVLDLEHCLKRYPGELSGGQSQRVALGRALVRQARVLLLDEPLSNLDPQTRLALRQEILRLHAEFGTTMVYVTHDQAEALALGRRIAVLKEGTLQQVGAPQEVYQNPANAFVAGFLGFPPMNFIEGILVSEVGGLIFQEVMAEGAVEGGIRFSAGGLPTALPRDTGGSVLCGIRPEQLQCHKGSTSRPPGGYAAVVSGVQMAGSDLYLQLALGAGCVVAKLSVRHAYQVGERIWVEFDPAEARLFDRGSGRALG